MIGCGGRAAVVTLGEGVVKMGDAEVLVLHADGTLRFADQPADMRFVVTRAGVVELTVRGETTALVRLRGDSVRATFAGTTMVSAVGADGTVTVDPAPATLTATLRMVAADPRVRRTMLRLMTVVPFANHLRQQR
jgi:hypothetical protein